MKKSIPYILIALVLIAAAYSVSTHDSAIFFFALLVIGLGLLIALLLRLREQSSQRLLKYSPESAILKHKPEKLKLQSTWPYWIFLVIAIYFLKFLNLPTLINFFIIFSIGSAIWGIYKENERKKLTKGILEAIQQERKEQPEQNK